MPEYSSESGVALLEDDQSSVAAPKKYIEITEILDAGQYEILQLAHLTASPTNPRKTFDPVTLAELAETIKASGVHTPILVRPLPGSRVADTDRQVLFEIVAGERRYRASKLAGVSTIPSLIRNLTDNQVLEIQIVENLQRDDLSPMEEAYGYEQLCNTTGISKEHVGKKIKKSRAYVYARLKLLDLSQECKEALSTGTIDFSRAVLIARVPDTALQHKSLAEATRKDYKNDVPSTRELQIWLQKNVMLRLEGAPFNTIDTQLCPNAGSCKVCPKRTGADPDLFSEVESADLCTDPPCYQAKEAAHRAQLVAKAEAKGMRVIDGKEAKSIFKESFGDRMGGFTRLDQRRNDIDSDGPTLSKLLGEELKTLSPVLIEHPHTKELIEAVPTAEAEALLITRGLIKQTRAAEGADRQIETLKQSMEARVRKESRQAIMAHLASEVHASRNGISIISSDLIRAWLTYQTSEYPAEDMGLCLGMPVNDNTTEEDIRLRIQSTSTNDLWKALVILMILPEDPLDYRSAKKEETPAFDALAKSLSADIDAIVKDTRATIKAEVSAQISAIKAEIKAPKPPHAAVAISKGEGGANTKTKKTKTTAAEAQAAIAAAMQSAESETDSGAAIAAQGDDAGSGFALPGAAEVDPLYDEAVALVQKENKVSISLVQRHLKTGYNNAARLIEKMEAKGLVSPMSPDGKRSLLASPAASEINSGAAIASQGYAADSSQPVAGSASAAALAKPALSVGTKVQVTDDTAALGTILSKWASSTGTVTRCADAVPGWDVKATVTFKGRNGGVAELYVSTLKVIA